MKGIQILMVSPTPTHPQDAGNRARIFQLAEQLRLLGCDLSFLFYALEQADLEGMRKYWGERILIFPVKSKAFNASARWNSFSIRLGERLRAVGIDRPELFGRPLAVDDWYHPGLEGVVRHLHAQRNYHMVWVEYVFLSKILEAFDSSVIKVIDTHDVFSNRHKMMMAQGIRPEWFYTTPAMERKGLERADVIIAIHEHDAEAFKAMGLSQVVTIGHFIRIHPPKGVPPRNKILFIGSDNSINLRAWEYFAEQVLGRIEERIPGTSIQVAGKICKRIPTSPRYQKLGVVEDLRLLYESTTVAINPVIMGTGLKIKTIEPLAYGCPVVTTPQGIQGIEEARYRGILVGQTPMEFAECIEQLLGQPSFWEEQRRLARVALSDYVRRNEQRLSVLLHEQEFTLQEGR